MNTLHLASHIQPWGEDHWEQALDDIYALEYQGVEGVESFYQEYSDKVEVGRRLLEDRNLQLVALSDQGDYTNPDLRADILTSHLSKAEFLHNIGAKYLILETGTRKIFDSLRNDFRHAAETLNELGKHCQDYEIYACIVPAKGNRIETEEEIDRIMNEVDTRDVFLCLDSGQLVRSELDPVRILSIYGSCVKHIHFSDVPRTDEYGNSDTGEENFVFCPPGLGQIDFLALTDVLYSLHYSGWITTTFDSTPEDALEQAKKAKTFIESIITQKESS